MPQEPGSRARVQFGAGSETEDNIPDVPTTLSSPKNRFLASGSPIIMSDSEDEELDKEAVGRAVSKPWEAECLKILRMQDYGVKA